MSRKRYWAEQIIDQLALLLGRGLQEFGVGRRAALCAAVSVASDPPKTILEGITNGPKKESLGFCEVARHGWEGLSRMCLALEDAASIAGLLVPTEVAVAELPEKEPAGPGAMGGLAA
jgi:hypothetical protein